MSLEKYTMQEGDTGIDLVFRLKDRRGYADLTGAVVLLDIAPYEDENTLVITGASCTPHADQSALGGHRGEARHVWTAPEVALLKRAVGLYRATFPVTKSGQTTTFPRAPRGEDFLLIEVT